MDKKTVIETKIEQFNFKVCNSFKLKLRNDQICYDFDPNLHVKDDNKDHIKHGLYLILDENRDRQMDISKSTSVAEGYFHDMENEVEKGEGIQIYLEAIGKVFQHRSCKTL